MANCLNNVGKHTGTGIYNYSGDGHYEATFESDGTVIITTVFDSGQHRPKVTLSHEYWDRLVAWVEWQRKNVVS